MWLYDSVIDPDVLELQIAQLLNRIEELKSELKTALKEKEEAVELVDQIRDENEQCLTANRHLTKELKKLESIILSLKKQRTISEEELSASDGEADDEHKKKKLKKRKYRKKKKKMVEQSSPNVEELQQEKPNLFRDLEQRLDNVWKGNCYVNGQLV